MNKMCLFVGVFVQLSSSGNEFVVLVFGSVRARNDATLFSSNKQLNLVSLILEIH